MVEFLHDKFSVDEVVWDARNDDVGGVVVDVERFIVVELFEGAVVDLDACFVDADERAEGVAVAIEQFVVVELYEGAVVSLDV